MPHLHPLELDEGSVPLWSPTRLHCPSLRPSLVPKVTSNGRWEPLQPSSTAGLQAELFSCEPRCGQGHDDLVPPVSPEVTSMHGANGASLGFSSLGEAGLFCKEMLKLETLMLPCALLTLDVTWVSHSPIPTPAPCWGLGQHPQTHTAPGCPTGMEHTAVPQHSPHLQHGAAESPEPQS